MIAAISGILYQMSRKIEAIAGEMDYVECQAF